MATVEMAKLMGTGECKLEFDIKSDSHSEKFWYQDISQFLKDKNYFVITNLFTKKESRNKGYATELLKEFCKTYNNKIIIVEAAVSKIDYPEEPSYEEYDKVLNKINNFFTKRGFSNFNTYSKTYEFKEAYIYTETEQGKEVYEAIKKYYSKENK